MCESAKCKHLRDYRISFTADPIKFLTGSIDNLGLNLIINRIEKRRQDQQNLENNRVNATLEYSKNQKNFFSLNYT